MTGLGRKQFFIYKNIRNVTKNICISIFRMFTCAPPIFSYFLGSFIGIGSSLLLIVFSNHTDNPEIHKCRFCLCKVQTFAQSGLKHLQFTPEGL
jgi:hypothetical protein